MYYIVEYCADGGQMCVPGRRVFTSESEQKQFAERERAKSGHLHGPESVEEYTSEVDPGNEGYEYPLIANEGREMRSELQCKPVLTQNPFSKLLKRFF